MFHENCLSPQKSKEALWCLSLCCVRMLLVLQMVRIHLFAVSMFVSLVRRVICSPSRLLTRRGTAEQKNDRKHVAQVCGEKTLKIVSPRVFVQLLSVSHILSLTETESTNRAK